MSKIQSEPVPSDMPISPLDKIACGYVKWEKGPLAGEVWMTLHMYQDSPTAKVEMCVAIPQEAIGPLKRAINDASAAIARVLAGKSDTTKVIKDGN